MFRNRSSALDAQGAEVVWSGQPRLDEEGRGRWGRATIRDPACLLRSGAPLRLAEVQAELFLSSPKLGMRYIQCIIYIIRRAVVGVVLAAKTTASSSLLPLRPRSHCPQATLSSAAAPALQHSYRS